MATYVNDLRLTELATGEGSGTWGTTTNTNLELIGEALGYGTQDCFTTDADATTTVADGASDPARAMYFKVTSSATLTATRVLTIAPNTVSRVMFIENATTGSQSITISQGSGANVTIATGKTTVVYLDGAGSGAAVVDALALVDPGVTDTLAEVLVAGNTSGGTNIELSTTDKVQFRDAAIYLNSSVDGQLDIVADTEVQIAATTIDVNGTLAFDSLKGTGATTVTNILDEDNMASDSATALATQQSIKAYVDSQVASFDTLAEVLAQGNTTGGTDIAVGTGDDITFADSSKAIFGSATDLSIYSDGSNSYIQEGSGTSGIRITTDNSVAIRKHDDENIAVFNVDGAVRLYYDNAEKIATTTTGVNVTGTVTADGLTVESAGTIQLTQNTTAAGDLLGRIEFHDEDAVTGDGGVVRLEAIRGGDVDAPDFQIISTTNGGVLTNRLFLDSSTGNIGINESSPDTLLHLSGANNASDANNALRFTDTDTAVVANQKIGRIEFETSDTSNPGVNLQIDAIYGGSGAGSELVIYTGVAGSLENRMFIEDSATIFNEDGADNDFRVESDTQSHMLFVDASENLVGVNTGTPDAHLDVNGSLGFTKVASRNISTGAAANNYFVIYDKDFEASSFSTNQHYVRVVCAGPTSGQMGTAEFYVTFKQQTSSKLFNIVPIENTDMILGYIWDQTGGGTSNGNLKIYAAGPAGYSYIQVYATNRDANPDNNILAGTFPMTDTGSTSAPAGMTTLEFALKYGTNRYNQAGRDGNAFVINESGYDIDFRVESDSNTHALFVDAGNSYVGVNCTPGVELDVQKVSNPYQIRVGSTLGNSRAMVFADIASTPSKYNFLVGSQYNHDNTWEVTPSTAVGGYTFSYAAISVNQNGFVTINEDSQDRDFRVESDTNSHLLYVEGSGSGAVGVNNSSPLYNLDVNGSFRTVYSVPAYTSTSGSSSSANYWKLGTISNLTGSRSLKIRILGTSSYSAGGEIAGETEILIRGNNATTTVNGTFFSTTQGNSHVQAVAWQNTGTDNEFDIWVKWAGTFAGTDTFIESAGQWVFGLLDTGSTSQPAGSTLLSPIKTEYMGNVGTIRHRQSEVSINEGGLDLDFRVESDNNDHMLFVDAGNDSVSIGTSGTPHDRAILRVNAALQYDGSVLGGTANIYQSGSGRVFTFGTGSNGDQAFVTFHAMNHNGFIEKRYYFYNASGNWTKGQDVTIASNGTPPTITYSGNGATPTITVLGAGGNPDFYGSGFIYYQTRGSITFA